MKKIVIVLGNRLNDDGSISRIQEERLEMALELEKLYEPDYFILSGGLANPKAGITEAKAMYNYLVGVGLNPEKLVLEDKSLSTVENAKFSVPLAETLGAEMIIVCSSSYHFGNPAYKLMESFVKELDGRNLVMMTYMK